MFRITAYILPSVLLVLLFVMAPSCKSKKGNDEHAGHNMSVDEQVEHNAIHLNERMRLLANISTDTVKMTLLAVEQIILGTLTVDENKAEVISARVSGRLDRLLVKNPGEKIRKGQALYAIYSEQLLVAENEYLYALETAQTIGDTDQTVTQLLSRAKKRLQLWGFTEKQISTLAATLQANPRMTFYSPATGYLTNLSVREGEYVAEGTPLFEVADLSTVWVEAQVYPNELEYLNAADPVKIEFDGYPDKVFTGVPVFRSPALEENSKVYLMRYKVLNPTGSLKPGMMAYVSLGNAKKRMLTIPKSALLLSAEKAVWVETAKGQFEMRMVKTGRESREMIEVLSGLKEGEVVVTSGAYLLNSKNIIDKGATHTMPGM